MASNPTEIQQLPAIDSPVNTLRAQKNQRARILQEKHARTSRHLVQFYESDKFLVETVSSFIGAGLGAGEGCVVIATEAHRAALEQHLRANGLDPLYAQENNRYITRDAAETLALLMRDEMPVAESFNTIIGNLLARVGENDRPVRVFGEMVMLLWKDGLHEAVIKLEELWNALGAISTPFTLLCAYSLHDFSGKEYKTPFMRICHEHTQVLPGESYALLPDADERLRLIAQLQQKAITLAKEIREHRSAERRLRASEDRFRRLAKQTPIMIWQSDATGSVIYVNEMWCTFTGLSEQESLGEGWTRAIHPDDRAEALEHWTTSLATHTPYVTQFRLHTADQASRYVQVNGAVCTDAEENFTGFIGTMVDITEYIEMEQQREAFTSLVTHELKTPLTVLQGNIQLAQRWLARLLDQQNNPEQQCALEEVLLMLGRSQQQLRTQNRLINDLLDTSSLHEDRLKLLLAPCDMLTLVYEMVQDYQTAYPSRLINLTLPETDFLPVYADGARIRQVLGNYLGNALKFSPESTPVDIALTVEGSTVRVSVSDYGPGLTRDQQRHIWDRFERGPRTPVLNGAKTGLGLGLYICRQLICRQQGQVGVESKKGKGSTFWFTLPLQTDPSHLPPSEEK